MRTKTHRRLAVCLRAGVFAMVTAGGAHVMLAQATQSSLGPRAEIAVTYEYVNSNVLPAGCGCFGLNGVGADFAWRPRPSHFAGVVDFGVVHAGSITDNDYTLTMTTFMAGVRYVPTLQMHRLQPYAQVEAGGAHASGSLIQGSSDTAFAGSVGGGLDLRTGKRFAIRLIEASYLATTFANGSNDHQNDLRLNTGVVLNF